MIIMKLNQCWTTISQYPERRLKYWQCEKKVNDAALDALRNIWGLYTELLDKTSEVAAMMW